MMHDNLKALTSLLGFFAVLTVVYAVAWFCFQTIVLGG